MVDISKLPLIQSHAPTTEPTYEQMLPSERVEKFGKIEEFTTTDLYVDKFKRAMNLITNTLFGDIPGVRKMLPPHIRETKPELPSEKIIAPLVEVGRDVYLYGKASKIVGAFSKGQYASKAARIIYNTVAEGAKTGIVGAVTAGSEDPIDIAKKAGAYAAFGAASAPAMEAISYAGSKVAELLGKSKTVQELGEWVGTRLRENKVNRLVRNRYGEINSKLIDSEVFLDKLSKNITKTENKSLAYIVEAGNLNKIKDQRIKILAKSIRKYLDDAHADLVANYGKDVGFIKDYIPHIWDIPKNKEKEVVNWFVTKNPHLQKRRIETIKEGIEKFGLKPKYENITDIIRVYDQIRIKSAANLKFVKDLMELQDETGINLVQRVDKAPSDWPMVDHPAVRKTMMIGKTTTNVPVEETVKTVTETFEKIKTIERSGGGSVKNKEGVIKRLESVMSGALEARGMTKGEAEAYIGRLKHAYAGVGEPGKESVSEKVKRSVKETIDKIENKKKVEIPILSKVGVRVNPDIYPDVRAVLDNWQPGKAIRTLDTINTFAKQSVLNLSLFHQTALTETGIATGTGKEILKAWNPVNIIKAFKNGTYKSVIEKNVLAKEAVKDGLEIGAISDVEGGRHLVEALKKAEEKLGNGFASLGIKVGLRKPLEYNNKFLWDYLHTTFKLDAYSNLKADMIKKFPQKDPKVIGEEVAQFVNDTFGGQAWDILAKSPQWKQFSRFILLSPDWVLSTMRQAVSPFGVGAASKAGKEIRKELGTDFWRRAIVYFGGAINMLNYAYTKAYNGKGRFLWENTPGKETYLFTGYNTDGTERYVRWGKQFRELSELMMKPFEVAGRKIAPWIRVLKNQFFPSDVWQREIVDNEVYWRYVWDKPKDFLKSLGKETLYRGEQLLKDVTPYSISQIQRVGELNPLSFAMPISKGLTPYNTRKLFKMAIITKDEKLLNRIRVAALANKIDPEPLLKQTIAQFKSEVTYENKKEARKIFIKLKKKKNLGKAQEYINSLDLSPGVEKQLIKIIKEHGVAIKKSNQGQ